MMMESIDLGSFGIGSSKKDKEDRRRVERIPLQLKVAIVYHQHEDAATRPTYHGRTNDISLTGLSVVVDKNIFNEGEVTVLLALPPTHTGGSQRVIEATAKMAYTVYSSDHGAFRIGLNFRQFKRKGKELLTAILKERQIKSSYTV